MSIINAKKERKGRKNQKENKKTQELQRQYRIIVSKN